MPQVIDVEFREVEPALPTPSATLLFSWMSTLVLGAFLLRVFALSLAWEWHAVPLGLPPISGPHLCALLLLAGSFRNVKRRPKSETLEESYAQIKTDSFASVRMSGWLLLAWWALA